MGCTINQIYYNSNYTLNRTIETLLDVQTQSSTGLAVSKPSDDPLKASKIIDLNSQIESIDNYNDNIDTVMSTMEMTESILLEITSIITDIQSLVMQTSESTITADESAAGVNDNIEQLLFLANTNYSDSYIFSGSSGTAQPFDAEYDSNGNITSISYQGSTEELSVQIADNIDIASNLCGSDIFYTEFSDAPKIVSQQINDNSISTTGVSMGTACSNLSSVKTLTVTETDTGDWQLSIDGGLSSVLVSSVNDITNVPVVDSTTGEVAFINASNITQAGQEIITPNQGDLFDVLITTRDTLYDEDLDQDTHDYLVDYCKNALEEINLEISKTYSVIGSKISTLTSVQSIHENTQYFDEEQVSELQDADMLEISIKLAECEALYQLSLEVTNTMFSMTLLNYMS